MTAFPSVEGHMLYALRNAPQKKWPFPHFYAENVFPADFYQTICARLSCKKDFSAVEGRYSGRTFAALEDFPELNFMKTPEFLRNIAKIFTKEIGTTFQGRKPDECGMFYDLRMIRDGQHYAIGPHTDAQWKLISLLFYLPPSNIYREHGTSIYLPKNRQFRCPGGPHHAFEDFDLVYTAPYLPNTCFGFFKTNNSFHGVEPLPVAFPRDVLLYNIYDEQIYLRTHKPVTEEPAP